MSESEKPKVPHVDHKTVANDVIKVCNKHKLTNDGATKCLMYTCVKLIAARFKIEDHNAAAMLSKAALHFRDEIVKVDKMFKNRG
jgi:hypothetical protein